MSLYSDWTDIAQQERTSAEHKAFWSEYFDAETENYKQLLADYQNTASGTVAELADRFQMEPVTFLGFLDGINTSLKKELKLDSLKLTSKVSLDIDYDKLYFNMLDAKANWLYTLPEWDAILTEERRKEITKEFRASKMFVKEETVGRNDPCPCGSGKKYKKCCGAGK
ncbi:MAG: SEC-C metal-binding domain-containing protein [Eubacteriales bacterium]|nr:SEC-C metal-binding domain-containing protein [Eubacteriales bacterium]